MLSEAVWIFYWNLLKGKSKDIINDNIVGHIIFVYSKVNQMQW